MKHYTLNGEQEKLDFNEEAVILHSEQFTVTTLNETGLFCWELLQQGKTTEEIKFELIARYDAPAEVIESDFNRFIKDLESKGLVRYERQQ